MSEKENMWGGRFSANVADTVQQFTESVTFDKVLYRQDIAGSKAHVAMLARQGILTKADADRICLGLDQISQEIERGEFQWQVFHEDVHMNIENRLIKLIGSVGKKVHTGRSRNDQVALDFRLYVSEATRNWRQRLYSLIAALLKRAEEQQGTLLPGFTHLQPAQPVSLGQHLLAYVTMFQRDVARLHDADGRTRVSPLGAAALAGTTYPLDPQFAAACVNMPAIFQNSMDAVSDRDFVLETVFSASVIMAHLSRFCEDIILWANPAFGFIRLPDDYATGSSIMPQKKNPDVAELMRGKTGRVYGALMGLLTMVKGLPMTYNRDLQEDKEPFFDTDKTVALSLEVMAGLVEELTFVPKAMQSALKKGFLNATELADYLVGKGVPFREAHHYTGSLVALAEGRRVSLEDLPLEVMQNVCPLVQEDVYSVLTAEAAVARRFIPGGTGPDSVRTQIQTVRQWLEAESKSD